MDLDLRDIFKPHQFGVSEQFIGLYHVYDNLSRTPYQPGVGIQCEDPDNYYMSAWHVIMPSTMRKHLEWRNRDRTQFISFYSRWDGALNERRRRRNQLYVLGVGHRILGSIRVAHVRLPRYTDVWVFSRIEMLGMMGAFSHQAGLEMLEESAPSEWFVWGDVPNTLVQRIYV